MLNALYDQRLTNANTTATLIELDQAIKTGMISQFGLANVTGHSCSTKWNIVVVIKWINC